MDMLGLGGLGTNPEMATRLPAAAKEAMNGQIDEGERLWIYFFIGLFVVISACVGCCVWCCCVRDPEGVGYGGENYKQEVQIAKDRVFDTKDPEPLQLHAAERMPVYNQPSYQYYGEPPV
mmetsp:Transcript_17065/g.42335  ORF Transcript_17065/g.42335 Transcript_17065/m.42335 type:complete len:120 (-) Transcript_17065:292-651(-)|eukprot:CAMPEP_0178991034 /NCGR_PEP_ID=MMETSP0795-20121207/5298_1 /TAXON_ID=88552 /ORGANISM="Amoebophrya sp., Strain Ameob2" /LENGTH=119 /DNA_ID=CAMNT_0020682687 /DNA_START=286 /DNA_END=645 /DNA_ORIENTATION=-